MSWLRHILEKLWFTHGTPKPLDRRLARSTVDDLAPSQRETLITGYQDCFKSQELSRLTDTALAPDDDALASFLLALSACEYGVDTAPYLPHDIRLKNLDQIASRSGWDRRTFLHIMKWWSLSPLRETAEAG